MDVNAVSDDGSTAVYTASYNGDVPMLRVLLAKGGDHARARSAEGFTAVCAAVAMGHVAAVEVLVDFRVEKGGFNVTSTCEFSDEMCQGKGPLFESSTRDELSSKTMSGN